VYLERYEDVPTPLGFQKPVIGLQQPVVEPQHDTKHTGDVIIEIAKAVGGDLGDAFPWDNYDACLEETLGDYWDTLTEEGFWIDSDFRAPSLYSAFDTDSGRFEFFAGTLKTSPDNDIDALPHYRPVKLEGDASAYPLVLVPYDSMRLASGYIGDPPFVVKTIEDTVLKGKDLFVEINPKTAMKQGLSEGRYAILSTPKGQVKVRVHLFEGLKEGLVALPRGLGHTAYDNYLTGKGINFNELIGPVEDPISGLDAAWGIRAKLTKA
jgi:anaerobic selenocysteine-containing dehydrogenase